MVPVTFMLGATALTVVAQLAGPGPTTSLGIARTVTGGFLATTAVLTVGALGGDDIAAKLAALVFVTALMVHGATLSQITLNYLK